ncbi:MAG TPA: hypothetical protein VK524_08355 [Polyangiaceae bacterium]|nr:hypothetical protein [Polyangiaceae bacterium]
MSERRLVLMPHGPPRDEESRERCMEILLRCGADLTRVFDGSDRPIDRFAEHVAGIADVVNAREIPLIVLTEIEPLHENVLRVRRVLEAAVAILERAPWLLYIDAPELESVLAHLQDTGRFDGPVLNAPLWTGPDGLPYLVVSSLVPPHTERALPERLHIAEFGSRTHSSTRNRRVDAPALRPTLRTAVGDLGQRSHKPR